LSEAELPISPDHLSEDTGNPQKQLAVGIGGQPQKTTAARGLTLKMQSGEPYLKVKQKNKKQLIVKTIRGLPPIYASSI
jgi:hypothetical protein